jgi:hypothetical protein
VSQQGQTFKERFHVQRFDNAAYFAGPLFQAIFQQSFPNPPPDASPSWAQYVAFFRWDEDQIEPVGFCNFLPHENLWLEGGLCVRRNFYARLPPGLAEECRATGGVAQLIMEVAAKELDDCTAWFAYVGDVQSLKVCMRCGYEATNRKYVIAKWFREHSPEDKTALIERVAALGPF